MKKHIIFMFFMSIAALTFAAPAPYAHLSSYTFDQPFLSNLAKGKKVTYQVCTYPYEEENEKNNDNFIKSLNIWMHTVEKFIKARENGKEEFRDILKILENTKNLERLPCNAKVVNDKLNMKFNADLNIEFSLPDKETALGYYIEDDKYMHINAYIQTEEIYNEEYLIVTTYEIDPTLTILHELGHVFGLADQYDGSKYKGSVIYNSLVERPSIMQSSDELTCDDVDGFITSVDRIRNKKRTFTSFCNDGIVLVNGKAENGWSPLFCAVIAGNISVAKLLIQHGIDVNAKNEKGGRCCMVLRNC